VRVIFGNERPRGFCEHLKARKWEARNEIEEYVHCMEGTKECKINGIN
jgi:hypothetical protein